MPNTIYSTRNSIALIEKPDHTLTQAEAFQPKLVKHTAAGFPAFTATDGKSITGLPGICIGISKSQNCTIHTTGTKVYKRNIATGNYTQIGKTYSSSDFPGSGSLLYTFAEGTKADGSVYWILVVNNLGSPDSNYGADVYRSTDFGATGFTTPTWSYRNASILQAPPIISADGLRVYVADYTGNYASCKIYESTDAGLTFNPSAPIYDGAGDSLAFHVHFLCFGMTDTTVWVTTGDSVMPVIRLDRNGPLNWNSNKIISSDFHESGNVLPLSDNRVLHGDAGALMFVDTDTKSNCVALRLAQPLAVGNLNYAPAGGSTDNGSYNRSKFGYGDLPPETFRTLFRDSRGLIYAPLAAYATPGNYMGLLVSADRGRTWVQIDRTTSAGIHDIVGEIGGVIYCNRRASGDSAYVSYSFPLVNAAAVNAIKSEAAVMKNYLAEKNSRFTLSGSANKGDWVTRSDFGTSEPTLTAVTGDAGSGNMLRIAVKSTDTVAYAFIDHLGTDPKIVGGVPAVGKYFLLKCKIRSLNGIPGYRGAIKLYTYSSGWKTQRDYYDVGFNHTIGSEWTEIVTTGKIDYDSSDGNIAIQILADGTYTQKANFNVDICDVFFTYADTPLWDTQTANFNTGVTPGVDALVVPLAGMTAPWTVAFDMIAPPTLEWAAASTVAQLVANDRTGIKINLSAAGRWSITDGTNTETASRTTSDYRHYDLIRVYLSSNGTQTNLTVVDAFNGTATTTGANGTKMSAPTALYLGSAIDLTAPLPGRFWGVRTWNKVLSSGDIAADITAAGRSIVIPPTTNGALRIGL